MSEIATLFQVALPALSLFALAVAVVAVLVLMVRPLGGLIHRRPRIVTTQRRRDLTRNM